MAEYRPSPSERMNNLIGAARERREDTADRRPAIDSGGGATSGDGRQRGWVPDLSGYYDDPEPEEPEGRPRARWSIALAALLVIVLLALLGVAGYLLLGRQPEATPVAAPRAPGASTAPGVVVHVAGAVFEPGLVTLPAGARVADAVRAAGGLREDAAADTLNLARVAEDGEQILVPSINDAPREAAPGAPGSPGATAPPAGPPAGSGKVNLNAADATALQELPGVGPATAEKIIAYRDENGPFRSVDELDDVSGIGPKTMERLRELVTV